MHHFGYESGTDRVCGGNGNDQFVFESALSAGNVDTISGFQTGLDDVVLDDAVFTGLTPGALPAAAFVIGAAAAAPRRSSSPCVDRTGALPATSW
ncbi:MAG TPA: hypothetical protein VI168_18340 [Croceibacterium sp.]